MNRRQFLTGITAIGLGATAFYKVSEFFDDGLINSCLNQIPSNLLESPYMATAWRGIDPYNVWDCHVHIVGSGDSGSGAWATSKMDSASHPLLSVQKQFYINGACIDSSNQDFSFVSRLTTLSSEMPRGFKSMLFAFDYVHNEDGSPNKDLSIFHIPNEYAFNIASSSPTLFEWVASIHPYRPDALDALDLAISQGAKAIKWLPSGMNINPADKRCIPYYRKLQSHNIPIISHTGKESAVQGGDQSFGNPLLLRHAINEGVRVVMAHCASDGFDFDLDNGNKEVSSFDLFSRMMSTSSYSGFVFGDISATTLFNHSWVLKVLLERQDWHDRLLNGSDYPLPGIVPLISINSLASQGFLTKDEVSFLVSLRRYNPLMFDFVLKRLISYQGKSFSASVFHTKLFFNGT